MFFRVSYTKCSLTQPSYSSRLRTWDRVGTPTRRLTRETSHSDVRLRLPRQKEFPGHLHLFGRPYEPPSLLTYRVSEGVETSRHSVHDLLIRDVFLGQPDQGVPSSRPPVAVSKSDTSSRRRRYRRRTGVSGRTERTSSVRPLLVLDIFGPTIF